MLLINLLFYLNVSLRAIVKRNCLFLSSVSLLDDQLLLLEHLGQVAILVHRYENIGAANKLLLDVQLGNRRPVRVLLDAGTELIVFENVKRRKLLGVDTLHAEDLDGGAREAALGELGGSLHEEDDWRRADGLVDGRSDLVGEEARNRELDGTESRGPGDLAENALFTVLDIWVIVRRRKGTYRGDWSYEHVSCGCVCLQEWNLRHSFSQSGRKNIGLLTNHGVTYPGGDTARKHAVMDAVRLRN